MKWMKYFSVIEIQREKIGEEYVKSITSIERILKYVREVVKQGYSLCAGTVKLTNMICILISRYHRD